MYLLPLYYCRQLVGHARCPDTLRDLPSSLYWGLSIPTSLLVNSRPDVLVAQLREDGETIHRARPFTQMQLHRERLTIRLVHLSLRPALIPLLQRYVLEPFDESRMALHDEMRLHLATIGKIIYLDRSRINVHPDNLREISKTSDAVSEDVSFPSFS